VVSGQAKAPPENEAGGKCGENPWRINPEAMGY